MSVGHPDGSAVRNVVEAPGALVTGSSGVVVARALVEAGITTILSDVDAAATPVDRLVSQARSALKQHADVAVRRMPSPGVLPTVFETAANTSTGRAAAVLVPPGRTDIIRKLASLRVDGPVVAVSFDAAVLGRTDIAVLDPPATAHGVTASMRHAVRTSALISAPVVVHVRAALGEGWHAQLTAETYDWASDPALATDSEDLDVGLDTAPLTSRVAAALPWHESQAGRELAIVCSTSIEVAVEAAVEGLPVSIIAVPAPSCVSGADIERHCEGREGVLVMDDGATSLGKVIANHLSSSPTHVERASYDANRLAEHHIRASVSEWLRDNGHAAASIDDAKPWAQLDPAAAALVSDAIARIPDAAPEGQALPAGLAAAFVLAQPDIGMPVPIDGSRWRSWQAASGIAVTTMGATELLDSRALDDAPAAEGGVFIVWLDGEHDIDAVAHHVHEQATIGYGAMSHPRELSALVAQALGSGALTSPHVIIVTDGAQIGDGDAASHLAPSLLASDAFSSRSVAGATNNPHALRQLTPAAVQTGYVTRKSRARSALARLRHRIATSIATSGGA